MKIIVGYRVKKEYPGSPPLHHPLTHKNDVVWSDESKTKEGVYFVLHKTVEKWSEYWEPIMIEKDIITDKKY